MASLWWNSFSVYILGGFCRLKLPCYKLFFHHAIELFFTARRYMALVSACHIISVTWLMSFEKARHPWARGGGSCSSIGSPQFNTNRLTILIQAISPNILNRREILNPFDERRIAISFSEPLRELRASLPVASSSLCGYFLNFKNSSGAISCCLWTRSSQLLWRHTVQPIRHPVRSSLIELFFQLPTLGHLGVYS